MDGQEESMTKIQRKAVGFLFGLYGNAGPKYTKGNHEFIRRTLHDEDDADHFQPNAECVDAFNKVMDGDWSPLPRRHRDILQSEISAQERLRAVVGMVRT